MSSHKEKTYECSRIDQFKIAVSNLDKDIIINDQNCETSYASFISQISSIFDQSFPLRQFKQKKDIPDPWITKSILESAKTKHKLFKRKQKSPSRENIEQYKIYNNIFNKTKRAAKSKYFKEQLQENKGNIKETWRIINLALNKKTYVKTDPLIINHNGNDISNSLDKANAFNVFFTNVGSNTRKKIPKSNNLNFKSTLQDKLQNSFFF